MLRVKLELSTTSFIWLFGLSMYNYCKMKSVKEEDRDPETGLLPCQEPIQDPSICILARWLDEHPEDCPIPRHPSPADIFQRLNDSPHGVAKLDKVSKKEFGLVLGREASAGYRWVVQGKETPPALSRLLLILDKRTSGPGDTRAWEDLKAVTKQEAVSRGVGDLFSQGSWKRYGSRPVSDATEEITLDEVKAAPVAAKKPATARKVAGGKKPSTIEKASTAMKPSAAEKRGAKPVGTAGASIAATRGKRDAPAQAAAPERRRRARSAA
jgi:hypothetical protein